MFLNRFEVKAKAEMSPYMKKQYGRASAQKKKKSLVTADIKVRENNLNIADVLILLKLFSSYESGIAMTELARTIATAHPALVLNDILVRLRRLIKAFKHVKGMNVNGIDEVSLLCFFRCPLFADYIPKVEAVKLQPTKVRNALSLSLSLSLPPFPLLSKILDKSMLSGNSYI
jgi:hypothetical protein